MSAYRCFKNFTLSISLQAESFPNFGKPVLSGCCHVIDCMNKLEVGNVTEPDPFEALMDFTLENMAMHMYSHLTVQQQVRNNSTYFGMTQLPNHCYGRGRMKESRKEQEIALGGQMRFSYQMLRICQQLRS